MKSKQTLRNIVAKPILLIGHKNYFIRDLCLPFSFLYHKSTVLLPMWAEIFGINQNYITGIDF